MMKPRSHTTTPYSCKKAPRGVGTALAAWCPTLFCVCWFCWVWTYRGLSRSGFKQICLRALYCFLSLSGHTSCARRMGYGTLPVYACSWAAGFKERRGVKNDGILETPDQGV